MKKLFFVWIALFAMSVCFTACADLPAMPSETANAEAAPMQGLEAVIPTPMPTPVPTPQPHVYLDIDLSQLHEYDAYDALVVIMQHPDDYVGKVIKMTGTFDIYHEEDTGRVYMNVFVMDETECCAQGLSFTLEESDLVYPTDYPEDGSTVSVVGEFEIYDRIEQYNIIYTQLKSAFFV